VFLVAINGLFSRLVQVKFITPGIRARAEPGQLFRPCWRATAPESGAL